MTAFQSSYTPDSVEAWSKDKAYQNLIQLFDQSSAKYPTKNYLGQYCEIDKAYKYLTYSQVKERSTAIAAGLVEIGLQPEERVAIIANNSKNWVLADQGILRAGLVSAPFYPTISAHELEYLLNDSQAKVIVAETPLHVEYILTIIDNLYHLTDVICMCSTEKYQHAKLKFWSFDRFVEFGSGHIDTHKKELETRAQNITSTSVASIVYTSGTTGPPKGAMLMHGNFCSNCWAVLPKLKIQPSDVELCLLPLCHVFERTVYYAITAAGASVCYVRGMETIAEDLKIVKPSLMAAVPRVYEKVSSGAINKAEQKGGLAKKIFYWAFDVGKRYFEASLKGSPSLALSLQNKLAHKLVFSKINEATGGNVRLFVSGGAPLRKDLGDFFLSAGFTIVEGYGLTETSPVICFNPLEHPKAGTVGKLIPDVEAKIADDGEILIKGPNVMLGYFNKIEATEKAIDKDGWFATGDIGRFDPDGYLMITDRKKQLLVMSNGKNVAPQPIEQAMKKSPYVEQVVLIGDNQKFISALVYPNYTVLEEWLSGKGLAGKDFEELANNQELNEFLYSETSSLLGEFNPYERPKKIGILPQELTQASGELTPTLKVKRRVVLENYASLIEEMYRKPKEKS